MLSPYILVLSPFADFLETFTRCLRHRCHGEWDVKARGPNLDMAELCRDARETMVLAIVELRMRAPGDKKDESGLDEAKAIKRKHGVPVILMACEMPENGLVDQWTRDNYIDEFLLLRSPYDKRWNHIDEILRTHIQVNKDLQTPYDDCPDKWSNMVKKVRQPGPPSTCGPSFSAADLAHLFHRLFPVAVERFDFEDVSGGLSDAATVRARVFHRGYPTEERVVIKWGEKSVVHSEEERVRQYVEQLGPRGVASIRWSAQLKNCAAIAYWSVQPRFGGHPEVLSDYVRRPGIHYQKQRDVIESIFASVFAPWYRAFLERRRSRAISDLIDDKRERERHGAGHRPRSLIHHCVSHLWGHRNLDGAKKKIASMRLEVPEQTMDPVDLINEALESSQTEIAWLCPQHGDLNPSNIFVVDDEPWIIDFGDVHLGHPMKDFATLEAALRFTVFYCFEDKYQHWIVDAEKCLQGFNGAKQLLKNVKIRPFLWKASTADGSDWPAFVLDSFWCTNVIRTLVEELFSELDRWQEHYSLMVMLSLLKIAGISHDDTPANQERRAQAYRAASLHAEVSEALLLGSRLADGCPSSSSDGDTRGKSA